MIVQRKDRSEGASTGYKSIAFSWNNNKPDKEIKGERCKINIFLCNKIIPKDYKNNWCDLCEEWTRKSGFLMKNHKAD